MNRARLLLLNSEGKVSQEFDLNQPNIVLGRSPQANVVIASNEVSRSHAQIANTANGFFLSDMGSTNGTFLNGEEIQPRQMIQLKSNDQLNLGEIALIFQLVEETAAPEEPKFKDDQQLASYSPSYNQAYEAYTPNITDDYQSIPVDYIQKIQQELPQTPLQTQGYQAHPYTGSSIAEKIYQTEIPAKTPQPLYLPPAPSSASTTFSGYGDSTPPASLSEEELALASEIFGAEKEKSKKSGVNFSGWDKMSLFKQKVNALQQQHKSEGDLAPDFNAEELFNQIMSGSTASQEQTNIPAPTTNYSADKLPASVRHQENPLTTQLKDELPQAYSGNTQGTITPEEFQLADLMSQNIQQSQYVPDTESYYYPKAANQDPEHFKPTEYAFDERKENSRDPFDDLKYTENDSVLAKLKSSPKELFEGKLRKVHTESKTDLQAVIKNYALPIALLVGAAIIAIVLLIRNKGVFG